MKSKMPRYSARAFAELDRLEAAPPE